MFTRVVARVPLHVPGLPQPLDARLTVADDGEVTIEAITSSAVAEKVLSKLMTSHPYAITIDFERNDP